MWAWKSRPLRIYLRTEFHVNSKVDIGMSKRVWICGALLLAVVFAGNCPLLSEGNQRAKKIVLIAGKKSHGPGLHEYLKSVKLLKVMLDESPNLNVTS